ncbi:hypothetical protein M3226_08220 [Neobacillus cucumis]|uniref:DUF3899 domain-containing protein n=1 Tax=Neobacillus cucumis TaxID=1740721 RepID=UPI0020418031|nr:DUF3899 domain-containing protein [Neobacillus cucumis]MCM3725668.1 hypothetical protein [Neobacillus cucumis]
MKTNFKKNLIILSITQLMIVIISLIFHHNITLNSYIDISFFVTAGYILLSLLLFTIHSGFYDVMSKSFNYVLSRKEEKRRFEDIPGLSELITINEKPLLLHGLITGLLMTAALIVYYA